MVSEAGKAITIIAELWNVYEKPYHVSPTCLEEW